VTSCEMEASKSDSGFSLAGQPAGSSDSPLVIKHGDPSQGCSYVSPNDNTEDHSDIMTNWWRTPDSTVTDSVSSSCSSQSSEMKSIKEESGKNMEDDVVYEKLDRSAVESPYEPLDDCSKHVVSEENQCRKIPFADEKLRLIYKLILSSQVEFRAEVRVKLDKHLVKISGAALNVGPTEIQLHEVVARFVTAGVSISETSAKLLSTKLGEDWLDAQLEKEQLVAAVFYVKDTKPMIMADCRDRLVKIKHMIESSLIMGDRQIEQHHTKLMQSAVWNECIEDLHSTLLLYISIDYGADMRLVVEGWVNDVEVALEKFDKMLAENSRISHCVRLRRGVYRVLCFRRSEIQQEAKYVTFCI